MAVVGLSKSYVAKYSHSNGTVTYSEGTNLGPATEFSTEIEAGKNNDLYGDNGIQETSRTFSGGTLTHSTTELTQEGSSLILGITPSKLTIGDKEVTELVYDDDVNPPYLGFGTIVKKIIKGLTKWRGVVITKIMYNTNGDSATTQGAEIEWQVPKLTAQILRDDSPKHCWKREATFDTEEEADTYIRHLLNITTGSTGGGAI